jgi:arginyl-tRNA synthetase
MKGGEEVKISKRAGSYVTLRDLIDWTSRDAVRFFLLSRKADSEFTFDVDLALKRNDENPVFYVQYAHARICSVIRNVEDKRGAVSGEPDLALLVAPTEAALMLRLAEFPAVLANAAANLAPHDITFYLRDLAGAFHSYYGAERVLGDDAALEHARVALLMATRQVIRNALAILGVSAPERMAREADPAVEPEKPESQTQ